MHCLLLLQSFSLLQWLFICLSLLDLSFFYFSSMLFSPTQSKERYPKNGYWRRSLNNFEHVDIFDEFCDLKTSFCLSSYVLSLGTYPYTRDHKDDLEGLEWEEGRDSGRTNETNETSDPMRRDRIKMWPVSSTGLGLHWHCLQVVPGSTEQDAVQE